MFGLQVYAFLSAVALAAYSVTGGRYLGLVYDHSFSYLGFGLPLAGILLARGLGSRRIDGSSLPWLWGAVVSMPAGAWLAVGLGYGTTGTFLLWLSVFILPFFLWAVAGLRMKASDATDSWSAVATVLGVVTGFFTAYNLIPVFQGLWAVQMMAAALLALCVVLVSGRRRLLSSILGLLAVGGLLMPTNSPLNNRLPQWSGDQGAIIKPVAVALAEGGALRTEDTRWVAGARIDRMASERSRKEGFGWLVTNGTAPVVDVHAAEDKSQAWWRHHFPLAVYPVVIAGPRRMLTAGPARGAESEFASTLHVPSVQYLEYSDNPWENQPGKDSVARTLRELTRSGSRFDLVTLSIPHPAQSPWIGANAPDEMLVTREMFQWYLDHLSDGGILAVTTREEVLFAKAMVTVWNLLLHDPRQSVSGLGDRVRAFRLSRLAPFKGSYRYLALVSNGGFSEEQLQRIGRLLAETPVEPLIYESRVNTSPYRVFNTDGAGALDNVVGIFTRYFSWRFQHAVTMAPSSIWQTGFFNLSNELHPLLVGLLTTCLLVIIYGLLFSNRALRAIETPGISGGPSLAVLLFSLLVSSAVGVLLVLLAPQFASVSLGMPQAMQLVLWSAVVAGAVAGQRAGGAAVGVPSVALLLVAVLGGWAWLGRTGTGVPESGLLAWVLPVLMVASAFVATVMHGSAMRNLIRLYPQAVPWGWILSAASVPAGLLLFLRTWLQDGLPILLVMIAVGYVVVASISSWANRSEGATSPAARVVGGQSAA